MKVELQDVEWMLALRHVINSCPLEKIEWVYNGKPVPIDAKTLEDWKYMGLSNFTFAETEILNDLIKETKHP